MYIDNNNWDSIASSIIKNKTKYPKLYKVLSDKFIIVDDKYFDLFSRVSNCVFDRGFLAVDPIIDHKYLNRSDPRSDQVFKNSVDLIIDLIT